MDVSTNENETSPSPVVKYATPVNARTQCHCVHCVNCSLTGVNFSEGGSYEFTPLSFVAAAAGDAGSVFVSSTVVSVGLSLLCSRNQQIPVVPVMWWQDVQ